MNHEKQLERYLERVSEKTGEHNAEQIKGFAKSYRAWPGEPCTRRILIVCTRLSGISQMLENKPLDKLTEQDFQELNLVMKKKGMKSAQDYRKTLKLYFRLYIKPQIKDRIQKADLQELMDSDYLKSPFKKGSDKSYVDRDEFWTEKQITAYLNESKIYSPRQLAFASLSISSGCRPHELLKMKKKQVEFNGTAIILRVNSGKTGKRSVVVNHNEGKAVWEYVQPYWTTIKDEDLLFPITWERQNQIHKQLCKKINLPEEKSRKLYIFRKMALTKFYSEYKYGKACALAGHRPGGKSARSYIAIGEEDLLGESTAKVSVKVCPNCGRENSFHAEICSSCGSPTDRQAFNRIITNITDEKVDAIAELVKEKMKLRALS